MRSAKRRGIRLRPILAALLLIISVTGCSQAKEMRKPVRPVLVVEQRSDNGICLDSGNTYLLYDYILQLEEGYE